MTADRASLQNAGLVGTFPQVPFFFLTLIENMPNTLANGWFVNIYIYICIYMNLMCFFSHFCLCLFLSVLPRSFQLGIQLATLRSLWLGNPLVREPGEPRLGFSTRSTNPFRFTTLHPGLPPLRRMRKNRRPAGRAEPGRASCSRGFLEPTRGRGEMGGCSCELVLPFFGGAKGSAKEDQHRVRWPPITCVR